jgi:hypothetical protein
MITTGFGVGELVSSVILVALNLALPGAVLFLLYKIYVKLKSIEEHLKKN